MPDLPRIGTSITLTQREADRLDELAEVQGFTRERMVRHALAHFDMNGVPGTINAESVFLRPEEQ